MGCWEPRWLVRPRTKSKALFIETLVLVQSRTLHGCPDAEPIELDFIFFPAVLRGANCLQTAFTLSSSKNKTVQNFFAELECWVIRPQGPQSHLACCSMLEGFWNWFSCWWPAGHWVGDHDGGMEWNEPFQYTSPWRKPQTPRVTLI